ncbi:MAG: Na-translocating system protein MpsC family protein [Solirubrobacteraceae bacterium]
MPTGSEHLRGGELNAAITVTMRDVMTHAEKALVQTGEWHAVMNMRGLLQQAMESDFKAAVERLTGRKVLAFVSGDHVDPDIAVETFILDHPPAAA